MCVALSPNWLCSWTCPLHVCPAPHGCPWFPRQLRGFSGDPPSRHLQLGADCVIGAESGASPRLLGALGWLEQDPPWPLVTSRGLHDGFTPPRLGHCGTVRPPFFRVSAGKHYPFPKAAKAIEGAGMGRGWLGTEGQLCCSLCRRKPQSLLWFFRVFAQVCSSQK